MRNRGAMSKSRREFLTNSSLGLLGIAVTSCNQEQKPAPLPPGAPPAFATAPPVGPEVSPVTFAEAEKLVQVELSEEERKQAAEAGAAAWLRCTSGALARARSRSNQRWRPGPTAKPRCPGSSQARSATCLCAAKLIQVRCPPATRTSRSPRNPAVTLDRNRKLTSERLTNIYLQRMERFNPTCIA
jgi:hypothetical protein